MLVKCFDGCGKCASLLYLEVAFINAKLHETLFLKRIYKFSEEFESWNKIMIQQLTL